MKTKKPKSGKIWEKQAPVSKHERSLLPQLSAVLIAVAAFGGVVAALALLRA